MALNHHIPIISANTGAAFGAATRMRRYDPARLEPLVKQWPKRIEANKKVILSVEHYTDTGEMLRLLLGMAGYEVRDIGKAEDALELANKEVFDLYLIGDLLPYGSSFDLVKQIRKFNSKTPLIVHSALAYTSDIIRGLSAGAQDYLVKPCDTDYLLNSIKRHINRSAAQWF